MRVLICGGRDYVDRLRLDEVLRELHLARPLTEIIHGGARGADRLAGQWANEQRIPFLVFEADWKQHGKGAGPVRNARMLAAKPDLVVAFPGGRGTADMVRRARAAGVEVVEIAAAVTLEAAAAPGSAGPHRAPPVAVKAPLKPAQEPVESPGAPPSASKRVLPRVTCSLHGEA